MFISASSCNHSSLIGCLKILDMTLDVAPCLGCLWMHKLYLDAPGQLYRWSRWPLMELDVLDVCRCTSFALMQQNIYMDDQDYPWSSWMSWMYFYAQVVPWCTKTFIGMIKITLIAPGCLGCWLWTSWVLKHHWDLYGCPWCSWMSWMSMDVQVAQVGCSRWPWMQLHDQDDPRCSWMSWMFIDTQVLPWCTKGFIWMLKMTLIAAGCLGCLSILKLSLDAPKHFYWCSRWPLI